MTIYDPMGREIKLKAVDGTSTGSASAIHHEWRIDVSMIPNGVYLLRVVDKKAMILHNGKLVIQR